MVDLLQELTDIDTLHESEEGAEVLIDALVSKSGRNSITGITGLSDGISGPHLIYSTHGRKLRTVIFTQGSAFVNLDVSVGSARISRQV